MGTATHPLLVCSRPRRVDDAGNRLRRRTAQVFYARPRNDRRHSTGRMAPQPFRGQHASRPDAVSRRECRARCDDPRRDRKPEGKTESRVPDIVDLNAEVAKLTMFQGRTPRSRVPDIVDLNAEVAKL